MNDAKRKNNDARKVENAIKATRGGILAIRSPSKYKAPVFFPTLLISRPRRWLVERLIDGVEVPKSIFVCVALLC